MLGALGTSSGSQKSIADLINKVSSDKRVRVAQSPGSGKKTNKLDGNPFSADTTYHSYTWDVCEKWLDAKTCEKWLDAYVSSHGFGGEKSRLEGKIAELYAGVRDQKNESQWALWNIKGRAGMPIVDDQGRLNRKALSKFELKQDIKEKIDELAKDSAQDLLIPTIDKSEAKNTMPNMEAMRAIAANLTVSYRNNLMGILGASRRNAEGIEVPGGENLVGCDVITTPQNEEETEEKLFEQGNLSEITRDTELQKRLELCRQIMSKPYKMVNPQVENGEIVSGDPNTEQVDQALARINLEVIDDLSKDANSVTKPADIELTQEQVASAVVMRDDNGKEKTVYEMPKDQIEAYNAMLDKAAKAQKEVSRLTLGHIPHNSNRISSNKLDDSISLIQLNSLTNQMKKDLKGQKLLVPTGENLEEKPVDLIQLAN